MKPKGWRNESRRHSLASRGIKTAQKLPQKMKQLTKDYEMGLVSKEKMETINEKLDELGKAFEDMKKAGEEEERKRIERSSQDVENPYFDAQTLFKQLGGNRFRAMTGAKNFIKGGNFLQFDIPKAKDGINRVKISLQSNDTYKMEFGMIRTVKGIPKYFPKGEYDMVYNDQLQELFTERTGLYTSLGTMGR